VDLEIKPWKQVALVFPGQGSQHVGMGEQLAKASRAAREVFRQADEILNRPLSRIAWQGPEEELDDTANTQPAILATSVAFLAALRERWETPAPPVAVAGHSLGEFSAMVAAEVMDFETALKLVEERGRLMEESGREQPGGMASIMGMPEDKVAEICEEARSEGDVQIATSNCEGHTVISGALNALQRAMQMAEQSGARKVVRLQISIASHSPLMSQASDKFNRLLSQLRLREPSIPVVGNVSARLLTTRDAVLDELTQQLVKPVLWARSVTEMRAAGADMIIEVGPGQVLTRLVRRVDETVNAISLSDPYDGLFSENFQRLQHART
jgi:[acyl-carrier-protein] S-malonyltransferase